MALTSTRKQIREAAADNLGLLITATADAVDTINKTVTMNKLADAAPDPLYLRDSYLTKDGSVYRRITKFDYPATNRVFLTDNLPGLLAGDPVAVYFLLDLDSWNGAVNAALRELYRPDRAEITLVAGVNSYLLPDWIQTREQVLNLEVKTNQGSLVSLEDWGGVRYVVQDHALSVVLPYVPHASNTVLVVTARRPYDPLTSDTATTTCPYPLAVKAAEVQALRRIFKKHGEAAKQRYAPAIVKAEQELAVLRQELLPPIVAQPLTIDESFGPDHDLVWSW